MEFGIFLAPEALEDIRSLKASDRAVIKDALNKHLSHEPQKLSRSRIKRLRGVSKPQYRLKLGDYRVFYDVSVADQRVEVLAVVPKSETDKWLVQFGSPAASELKKSR